MLKVNKRFKGPRTVDGPTVMGVLSTDGKTLTIHVVGSGPAPEGVTVPRLIVRAASDDARDVIAAATAVEARVIASKFQGSIVR